jgi:Cu(I)/Ag(I) efflux system membrane fusion protein
MALANDDLEKSTVEYRELIKKVSDVDMDLFKDGTHRRWMEVSEAIADAAGLGASAASIVGAREAFFHLSLATIELHDTFGHAGDDPFYLTYCPMARDNSGAFWLQQEDIVWNSFFGAMMLRCGEIKQELHAVNAIAE